MSALPVLYTGESRSVIVPPSTFPIMPEIVKEAYQASVWAERERAANAAQKRIAARETRYARIKAVSHRLTDDQRLNLAAYLIDQIDCDEPDLKGEAESIFKYLGRAVRGEW